MSIWSERKEAEELKERNKESAKIGRHIRSLPKHKQQIAKDALKAAGIDVDEAMHQSAPNRFDPHW